MKILVTGASGFTGIYLLDELRSRKFSPLPLKSNLLDVKNLRDELKYINPDFVFHLAGLSHITAHDAENIYLVNAVGSHNLVTAICELCTNTKTILLASTSYVYAESVKKISETDPVAPDTHYAMSKLSMEFLCKNFSERINFITTRAFNYTGIGQNENFFIPKLIRKFQEKSESIEVGNIEVEREFNDVRWVVSVLINLMETTSKTETFNICTGTTHKLTNVVQTISQLTKHYPKILISENLTRKNEKTKICGDPSKLFAHLNAHLKFPSAPKLESTIKHMLSQK